MKINRLLYSIMREPWFMQREYAESFMPQVLQMLLGTSVQVDTKMANVFGFVNQRGRELNAFSGEAPEPGSVAVIRMVGPVMKMGTMCAWGADELVDFMKITESSPNLIGTILKIDSGGGQASAIPILMDYLMSEGRKPVLAHVDLAASAAYYTAAMCDYIMAENDFTSQVGSVGAMTSFVDMRKYYEEKGITMRDIYASQSVHKNEDYRELLEGKDDKVVASLSDLAQRFMDDVSSLMGATLQSDAEGVLTGRMFSAKEALSLGMIHGIGNSEAALQKVRTLAKIKNQ